MTGQRVSPWDLAITLGWLLTPPGAERRRVADGGSETIAGREVRAIDREDRQLTRQATQGGRH
ncbi:hypothetical protein ACIG5E_32210 [Kitasatospora sp. NPDC053057]|uniref:hypothetical protein n=1 Tax=Kitasatospora sp. NPDC053057 TaxID=3364062 RepID=UPI0037C9A776